LDEKIRVKTGLQVDPLFPATKIQWLFENHPEMAKLADQGDLCVGTVDAWLVWNLTDRKEFRTDYSNASRTQLLNLREGSWDPELLDLFGVAKSILPELTQSNGLFGEMTLPGGRSIPIHGVLGDSHAALLGHGVLLQSV